MGDFATRPPSRVRDGCWVERDEKRAVGRMTASVPLSQSAGVPGGAPTKQPGGTHVHTLRGAGPS